MAWKNAVSVAAALAEATRRWPKRSIAADGTIGDAEHATRQSDHNPDAQGIVHAFDLTHDPTNGVDCTRLSAHLIAKRDRRVKYVIWNRQIVSPPDWGWRVYTGKNGHTKHMHVSVLSTKAAETDTSAWWDIGSQSRTLAEEAHVQLHAGNWRLGINYLNGLSMKEMLIVLDSLGPENLKRLEGARTSYAGGVNMARIEYALYVVQTRSLPAAAPGDLEKTGQVKAAQAFLAKPKASQPASAGSISLPTGPPLAKGQRRPLPPGYGPLRHPSPAVVAKSNELLKTKHPIGTHIPLSVDGRQYLFAVEWHKHPPTDNVSAALKDWHRGISVYEKQ